MTIEELKSTAPLAEALKEVDYIEGKIGAYLDSGNKLTEPLADFLEELLKRYPDRAETVSGQWRQFLIDTLAAEVKLIRDSVADKIKDL